MNMLRHVQHKLYGFLRRLGGRVPDRDIWPNGRIAFLSLLGYSVGFGNFSSFPMNCHKYGGGKFWRKSYRK